jgi:hypothetical protein
MTKLKHPIRVNDNIKNELLETRNMLLYSTRQKWFILIKDIQFEDQMVVNKKRKWWGSTDTTSAYEPFIVEATIMIYKQDKGKWMRLTDVGISYLTYYESPKKMRDNYLLGIRAPLESMGVIFPVNNGR